MPQISFALVLTLLTLILSLVPAVLIWVTSSTVMGTSLSLLQGTTTNSTNDLAHALQELYLEQALSSLNSRLLEGEAEMTTQLAFMASIGMLSMDLSPPALRFKTAIATPYGLRNFADLSGQSFVNYILFGGALFPNGMSQPGFRTFWIVWQSMLIDVVHNVPNRTLYYSTAQISADLSKTQLMIFYNNQLNGQIIFPMEDTFVPPLPVSVSNGWWTDLRFNQYSGQCEVPYSMYIPAENETWAVAELSLNTQTVSDELKAQLSGAPNDRLFLFFRQPHGHMIGVSDGKFYSDSNVDARYINPLTNPVNLSTYQLWNCTQSNDVLIQEACMWLIAEYGGWMEIPALRQQILLNGSLYWIAVGYSQSALNSTVVMLKNRESVMGSIDSSNALVDSQVASRRALTYVVLAVITALAILLPLSVGLWLGHRLLAMAGGMDHIAKLEFDKVCIVPSTHFSELHKFQRSFVQMERGLRAFGKFVPQAVVKTLVDGNMDTTERMMTRIVTIMFADIEGFSTICEQIPPEDLVETCTEYFEAMCGQVIQSQGTVDKFIGDCIMALWNAPQLLEGHEARGIASVLAMQEAVMGLHMTWQQRGLPQLKFRAGIHTGPALVGNFGCSFRVSYTVLGDNVNVAARLEALNKRFGTYLLVSHATHEACSESFHFRHLAKVSVPGRIEVFSVYEVVCFKEDKTATMRIPFRKPSSSPTVAIDVSNVEIQDVDSDSGIVTTTSETALEPMTGLRYVAVRSPTRRLSGKQVHPEPDLSPRTLASDVVYHWEFTNRVNLLHDVRMYAEAYDALVAGNIIDTRVIMARKYGKDKAWDILREQLELSVQNRRAWDGILLFRDK